MFGKRHKVKDIEVITTDNAMKWLKFDVSYKDWCGWVKQSKNMFGVVKTAHASKLGDVQKMSYQMVNSLSEDIMETVARRSVEYICRLKQDEAFFLDFLRKNANFSNDFEVLIALCEHNPAFVRSRVFPGQEKPDNSCLYSEGQERKNCAERGQSGHRGIAICHVTLRRDGKRSRSR